jgi:3',5'-cyclic-AMP phosphodiesterase
MSCAVRRIAHLSDVHILDPRPAPSTRERTVLRLLSFARVLDPTARVLKLRLALAAAMRGGADHVVISGDLTEVGAPAEFRVFADVLEASAIDPENITLVPGNHDLYTSPDAWRRALDGPLRRWAAGAAEVAGKIVERRGVFFLPLDVTRFQSFARSGGELTAAAASALERRLDDPALSQSLVVLVQHHSPFDEGTPAWHWWDGLLGQARLIGLLATRPNVRLLHGHNHRASNRSVGRGPNRVFGAAAVVDDGESTPRVRLYDVTSDSSLAPR